MLPAKTMLRLSDVGNKIPNDEQNTYEEILRVSPHAQVEAFYQNKLDMENPIKLQDLAEYIEENSQQEGTFKQKFVVSTIPHTCWLNTLRPRRNEQHSADDIFKHISSMKMFEFRLQFHWSLFPRVQLTIFQHWFR